ncbi:M20 metallopeptidase family protein [Pseudogracilibacillus sp. SO30301A]|uniref:M20 metallopeptidase family protein n=1 Tax=Pseudogracilibacillus sp. SO30301A TaxID=3098291 RepID=UPI00300E2D44
MTNKLEFLKEALKLKQTLIDWRRHLHEHPELSFQEYETSKFIINKLVHLDFELQHPISKTGIVAILHGEEPGPTVALRADMDALPIQDGKEKRYASKREGIAHLCGHDAHTAMLIGAAYLLHSQRPKKGNIKFIFQPAEEGFAGASEMVKEGVLDTPKVDVIAGLHVHPTAKTGEIAVAKGNATAFADSFDIEIIGEGGHAAHPHLSVDSIPIAAEIVSSLQQIVSRTTDPLTPTVLTIGKISGGYKRNVIAPSVKLEGTVRLLDRDQRKDMMKKMEQYIQGICGGMGATYTFRYVSGYPAVKNEEKLIPILHKASEKILGSNKLTIVQPSMGGEDFSYYTEKVPGIFFRLGIFNDEKECIYPNHHPLFDVDEDALPFGSALLAQFAMEYLNNE